MSNEDNSARASEALYVFLLLTAAADPQVINAFIENDPTSNQKWIKLQHELSNETAREKFARQIENWTNSLNWTKTETIAQAWGMYGWTLVPEIIPVRLWEVFPCSQEEADKTMMEYFLSNKVLDLMDSILAESTQTDILNEAIQCYKNGCFTACASLLLSLVDGTLISSYANSKFENKKTGKNAEQRIINESYTNYFFRCPGILKLQSINFHTYISQLFDRANNFSDEPEWINRNFVHHGMSKRQINRADCIKLFLAYLQSIRFTQYTTPARCPPCPTSPS